MVRKIWGRIKMSALGDLVSRAVWAVSKRYWKYTATKESEVSKKKPDVMRQEDDKETLRWN